MSSSKADLKAVTARLDTYIEQVRRFSVVGFIVLVAILYGFVLLRINTLSNAEPSQDSITSQVKAAKVPRIEPSVVKQLESLHDNSVNVRTLFNDTRSNPFR